MIEDFDASAIRYGGYVAQFLRLETAMGLLGHRRDPAVERALTALGVPANLQARAPDDDALADAVAAWADPLQGESGHYSRLPPVTSDVLDAIAKDLP